MKQRTISNGIFTTALLLFGITMLLPAGCATSNKGKVAQLWDTYAGAEKIATQLRASKVITADESNLYVKPLRDAAHKSIQDAQDAVVNGDSPTSQAALIKQAQDGLTDYQTWLAIKQAKK